MPSLVAFDPEEKIRKNKRKMEAAMRMVSSIGDAKKEKKKKRKVSDEEKSDTSFDDGEPVARKGERTREGDDGELEVSGSEGAINGSKNPNAVEKFRISNPLKDALKAKGIEALFPIQAMTFDCILDGSDMVGRARTGQGKTLAFLLPILESLANGQSKATRITGHGRPPSVLVLLPTRELATQVYAEFDVYGRVLSLTSCCLYGGSSYGAQEISLKRGVDIVVGTPGRIKDHIERGTLDLKSLKFRVLDEADEMLSMGFQEHVEFILGQVRDVKKVQTLLFSATLPDWVKKLSTKFLKPEKKTADLVGNEKLKASANVRHLVLPCSCAARPQIIPDIIRCYSRGGRTIIFTETKESASSLGGLLPGARALHGDIIQSQREIILAGFRSGRFLVLVATNVAARGLDINDVQLIIQCEPPRDVEAYIHRSGRTGRAGNTGVAILLYEPKYSGSIKRIEKASGVKFEQISPPQPSDVAEVAGSEAVDAILNITDSVVSAFRPQAEQLMKTSGLPAVDILAKALANAVGYTEIKKRSLLSSMENYVTLAVWSEQPIYSPSFAFGILKRSLPNAKVEAVKGMAVTADGLGAVFDVPEDDVASFSKDIPGTKRIEALEKLPALRETEEPRSEGGRRGRFGGGRGGNGGRRFLAGSKSGSGSHGRRGKGGGFAKRGRGRGGGGNRFNRSK